MTKKGSFLNASIALFVTPAILKPGSTVLKTFGCLIKDFRHDERGGFPPEFQAWRKGKLRLFFFPSLFQREKKEGVEAIAVRRFRLIRGGKIMVPLRWVDIICNPQKFALFNDLS